LDFYKILGVAKTATLKDIKKAYRDLAKIHHPDKGGDEEKFKEITRAFGVLSDPDKREKFDNGEEFDETYQSPKDKAHQNLCSVFDIVTGAHGFMADHTDLIVRMREEINEMTLKMDNDLSVANNNIKKIKSIIKRLKKADFIKRYAEHTLLAHEARKTQVEESIKVQGIMLELLEDSSYDFLVDDDEEWRGLAWKPS
jgi:curved DNA-binding protein CbpA